MHRYRLALTSAAVVFGGVLTATAPGAAAAGSSLTVVGHGYGHGRGMGQYGAYGYATTYHWTYPQILAHYYGGTALAHTAVASVRVRLDELAGAAGVTLLPPAGGSLSVNGHSWNRPVTVNATHPSGVAAAGCGGMTSAPAGSGDTEVCLPSGPRPYKGTFNVTFGPGATVVDTVALQDYVAGVVPSEMPASWGTSGGAAALAAQAVAARSYALADGAAGASGICDTQACQVYGGDVAAGLAAPYRAAVASAVSATAGQVLVCNAATACGPAGSVAFTEYSSSTGGWTAGGRFPAVVDAGDATPSNPNHDWSVRLSPATVAAAFNLPSLSGVIVTGRNGLGDLGGRVTAVTVTGGGRSVTVSGDAFAGALGLPSDWFALQDALTGPRGGDNGYWISAASGQVFAFGAAPALGPVPHSNAPVVGVAATADGRGYWEVASDGGIFTAGDARFFGSMGGRHLNRPVVGMTPGPAGTGYWEVASDGGVFTFGDAKFLGSMGGRHLNQPVVGIAATADRRGYWEVASDGGVFTFGDAKFFGSMGGRHLNQPIVGIVPTADGRGYWEVASDGGVFTFGDARFVGSLPGEGIAEVVRGLTPTRDNGGYLLVGASGAVYGFGDAPYFGDLPDDVAGFTGTVAGIAAHPG